MERRAVSFLRTGNIPRLAKKVEMTIALSVQLSIRCGVIALNMRGYVAPPDRATSGAPHYPPAQSTHTSVADGEKIMAGT